MVRFDEFNIKELKITDLGSAHSNKQDNFGISGTPEYIPPEILLNKNNISTDYSSDVWSVGVILLEFLSGIPVWMNFRCFVTK